MEARDVLFSRTQQRLIAVLFGDDAAQGLTYAEILRRTGGGAGAIHRELKQFEAARLVVQAPAGRRVFKPNTAHPVHAELRALARKLFRDSRPAGRLPPESATRLARKYLWWMKPQEAAAQQDRLALQVMNMGTFEDARLVETSFGKARLRALLKAAAPGQLDGKAWTFWHYRLGLAAPGGVPPAPRRRFN
ncbi:MAG: hypothetical protein ACT4P4_16085 [Betaproteobacteria bacterium]